MTHDPMHPGQEPEQLHHAARCAPNAGRLKNARASSGFRLANITREGASGERARVFRVPAGEHHARRGVGDQYAARGSRRSRRPPVNVPKLTLPPGR
jgi:hypothetical protein